MLRFFWTSFGVFMLASLGLAHDLSLTSIVIRPQGKMLMAELTTSISQLVKMSHLGVNATPAQLDIAIRQRLTLLVSGTRPEVIEAKLDLNGTDDILVWRASFVGDLDSVTLSKRFFDDDPKSRTILRLEQSDQRSVQFVYDGDNSQNLNGNTSNSATKWLKTGVEHILSGWDHVLFVLGLVLLGGGLKSLLKVVTAFTVAHCLTLFLSVTNVVSVSPRIIEPLIAASIVALAAENLRAASSHAHDSNHQTKLWGRMNLAFGFGLMHGFGFAGGLDSIGLSGWNLITPLLSFNGGVEIGQAIILLPSLGVLSFVSKKFPSYVGLVVQLCSLLLGMVGSYWLVLRVIAS